MQVNYKAGFICISKTRSTKFNNQKNVKKIATLASLNYSFGQDQAQIFSEMSKSEFFCYTQQINRDKVAIYARFLTIASSKYAT